MEIETVTETMPLAIGALGVLKVEPASKLSGALWQKEGELATTSLEFEYLHRKSRCEMLIGGGDIKNDVITLGTCLHSRLFPPRADCRKFDSSVDAELQGNWKWNSK